MRDAGRIADQTAIHEHRHHGDNVGQMGTAIVRIVQGKDVARRNVIAKMVQDSLKGGGHAAQMQGQTGALGDEFAVGAEQRGGIIQRLLDDE
jgi:hypothetical protein